MDAEIHQAIADKTLVEFNYQNFIRIAEPHAYGSMGGVSNSWFTKFAAEVDRGISQNGPVYHFHK
jgi:hypothetical protein